MCEGEVKEWQLARAQERVAPGLRSAELRQPVDPATQAYNPELGDGLLFHLGVYPVSFAQMLLGAPETVVAHGVVHESGVDVEEPVLLHYPSRIVLPATGATRRLSTPRSPAPATPTNWPRSPNA